MSGGYSVEAIILNSGKFGENDRMVTVLTRDRGNLRLVVRGAAKPQSKLASVTQPFDCVCLDVWRGRTLDGVKGGDVIHSLRRVRSEPELLGPAYCMAEIASYLGQEGEEDEPLYLLLLTSLRALAVGVAATAVILFFVIRAAGVAGFTPVLDRCVECGLKLEGGVHFYYGHGGALCHSCTAGTVADGAPLSPTDRQWALELSRMHPRRLAEYSGGDPSFCRLLTPFLDYLEYQMDRRVNSRYFLDMLI